MAHEEDDPKARRHQEEEEAMRRADPEDSLDNAPSEGETLSDFFAFEEIFARVLSTADDELDANNRYLFWSGIGAGGALGLTFLARVVLTIIILVVFHLDLTLVVVIFIRFGVFLHFGAVVRTTFLSCFLGHHVFHSCHLFHLSFS